jgi:hypothetical protein
LCGKHTLYKQTKTCVDKRKGTHISTDDCRWSSGFEWPCYSSRRDFICLLDGQEGGEESGLGSKGLRRRKRVSRHAAVSLQSLQRPSPFSPSDHISFRSPHVSLTSFGLTTCLSPTPPRSELLLGNSGVAKESISFSVLLASTVEDCSVIMAGLRDVVLLSRAFAPL